MRKITIGTRGSALALWQSRGVEAMLREMHPGIEVELEIIQTKGDKILDVSLSKIGDKGLFTKELENAILDRRVDIAVHSLKDMQTRLDAGLTLAAVTKRHYPEDALVAPKGMTLELLPEGATVATGSLRRHAQLLHVRPDLNVVDVRGNVQTRLQKYRDNGWDGMIMAYAGLDRMGLADEIAEVLPTHLMIPAVGQGALGIEARADDTELLEMLEALNHTETQMATNAERALLRTLEGGCQIPVAAYAQCNGNVLHMNALVATLDGSRVVHDSATGEASNAEQLGEDLALRLYNAGGKEILEEIRATEQHN